jgi:hypothetical protein
LVQQFPKCLVAPDRDIVIGTGHTARERNVCTTQTGATSSQFTNQFLARRRHFPVFGHVTIEHDHNVTSRPGHAVEIWQRPALIYASAIGIQCLAYATAPSPASTDADWKQFPQRTLSYRCKCQRGFLRLDYDNRNRTIAE